MPPEAFEIDAELPFNENYFFAHDIWMAGIILYKIFYYDRSIFNENSKEEE